MDVDELVERIVRDVAELPDRTSPDDWPEALLVLPEELADIIRPDIIALHDENVRMREALARCAQIVRRYNGRQSEKLDDIPLIASEALGDPQ